MLIHYDLPSFRPEPMMRECDNDSFRFRSGNPGITWTPANNIELKINHIFADILAHLTDDLHSVKCSPLIYIYFLVNYTQFFYAGNGRAHWVQWLTTYKANDCGSNPNYCKNFFFPSTELAGNKVFQFMLINTNVTAI